MTLIFLPVFIGRLTVLRDIYGASIFRPFARTTLTLATFQGLLLQVIFFSDSQPLFFEHKDLFFRFCEVELLGLLSGLLVSMVLEWPFRIMGRLVFSAPQRRILRLKGELAKELNTTDADEDIFGEEIDEEEIE